MPGELDTWASTTITWEINKHTINYKNITKVNSNKWIYLIIIENIEKEINVNKKKALF